MTIREMLNRRKRIVYVVAGGGFALAVVAVADLVVFHGHALLTIDDVNLAGWFMLVGLLILFLVVFIAPFLIRCPKCNGRLGFLVMASGHPLAISRRVRFCPCCGVNFDN